MNTLSDITITVGLYFPGEMDWRGLEQLHALAVDICRTFHPRSTLFWDDGGDPQTACRKLFTAALFEKHRELSNFILLATDGARIDLNTIFLAVNGAGHALNKCSRIDTGHGSTLFALSCEAADRLAEAVAPDCWFAGEDPSAAFTAALISAGIEPATNKIMATADKFGIVPIAYRLPLDVHFVPTSRPSHKGIDPAGVTAKVGTALNAAAAAMREDRIAFYGAGTVADALMALLGEKVTLVVDGNKDRQGTRFHHLVIQSPEALKHRRSDYEAVFITALGHESAIRMAVTDMVGSKVRFLSADSAANGPADGCSTPASQPSSANADLRRMRIIDTDRSTVRPPVTTQRTLTRRGVLYVGYPCNIKCVFCYYTYTQDKKWHSLEECMRDADIYRSEYGNEQVDITGGEPTIYPHIFELLDHCMKIKLVPSLITNTIALADLNTVKKFQDHGVYDFLCSVHALADDYDLVTARKGAWKKLEQAVINFDKTAMRWRTNCTMTRLNMGQLKQIARFAYENGSRVINFINYNPFYEWAQKMDIDFQARHSEIAPYLKEALDYCDKVGLEANVRYFPFCQMTGHEEKAYNYSQLGYDHHEWDYCSWFSPKTRNPSSKLPMFYTRLGVDEAALNMLLAQITKSVGFSDNPTCRHCAKGLICDGFTNQYARRFGLGEAKAYVGPITADPTHFIRHQKKIVDE